MDDINSDKTRRPGPGRTGKENAPPRKARRVPPIPPAQHQSRRLQIMDLTGETNLMGVRPRDRRQLTRHGAEVLPPNTGPTKRLLPLLPPPAPRREIGSGRGRFLETARSWTTPAARAAPKDEGVLLVPMVCAAFDHRFVLKFRKKGGILGKAYRLEQVMTGLAASSESARALSIATNDMVWGGISCPHCSAVCRPILCGTCNQLVCDGRATEDASHLYFRCNNSCGASGSVGNGLTSISGSSAGDPPAQRLLGPPATTGQTLPKRST